jgi:malate/lactate dehydrogenase
MGRAGLNVSVLGAGHVGSAVANALVLLRVCDLVVLYDRDLARAEGAGLGYRRCCATGVGDGDRPDRRL